MVVRVHLSSARSNRSGRKAIGGARKRRTGEATREVGGRYLVAVIITIIVMFLYLFLFLFFVLPVPRTIVGTGFLFLLSKVFSFTARKQRPPSRIPFETVFPAVVEISFGETVRRASPVSSFIPSESRIQRPRTKVCGSFLNRSKSGNPSSSSLNGCIRRHVLGPAPGE